MKKRLVSLLLVLAMVLAMVPAVLAEVVDVEIIEHNPSGGIEYVEPIKKPETEKKEIFAEFMSADGKFYKGMWLEVKDGEVELPTAKELGWNLERGIFVEAWKLGKNTYWFNWKSGSFQKADADDASEACFIADFNKKPVEDTPDEVYVTFKWGNKKSDKFTKAFETDKDGYITLDSKLKNKFIEAWSADGKTFYEGKKYKYDDIAEKIDHKYQVTLEAVWKNFTSATFTFVAPGSGAVLVKEQEIKFGNKLPTVESVFGDKGKAWIGWFDADGKEYKPGTKATKDTPVELYAKEKTPETVEVTFVVGNKTYKKTLKVNEYGTVKVPELKEVDPKLLGVSLVKWYTKGTGATAYFPGQFMDYAEAEKATLYADLESVTPVSKSVTFYANDGSGRWDSVKLSDLKNKNGKYYLPDADDLDLDAYWYSKTSTWYYNYNFICWNTKANGNGTDYYADKAYTSVPTTLYAVWGDKYTALPFVDVAKDAWYYESVCNVYNRGLMNGTSAWMFSPNGLVDRAMVTTILWRYAGQPVTYKASPFTDVASNAYYARAIDWAYNTGVVKGTSATTFGPGQNVTRQDLATILWRYAGSPKSTKSLSSFKDAASISDYAATAMAWAVEKGILNGSNGYLLPKDYATRAQVAAIFARMK